MDDRELLELAAKAAGLKVIYNAGDRGLWLPEEDDEWNPLTDDGDALRLAVKLEIDIAFYRKHVDATANSHGAAIVSEYGLKPDPYAATRRAIVRAAAEIGRKM